MCISGALTLVRAVSKTIFFDGVLSAEDMPLPLKRCGIFMNFKGNVGSTDQWNVMSVSVPCASCVIWNMEALVPTAVLRWLVKHPHIYSEPSFLQWNSHHSHREHGPCSEMKRGGFRIHIMANCTAFDGPSTWSPGEEGFAQEGGSSWGFLAGSLPGLYMGIKVIKM